MERGICAGQTVADLNQESQRRLTVATANGLPGDSVEAFTYKGAF